MITEKEKMLRDLLGAYGAYLSSSHKGAPSYYHDNEVEDALAIGKHDYAVSNLEKEFAHCALKQREILELLSKFRNYALTPK